MGTVFRGIDYVRGSLNWGPFSWLNGVSKTFGWWTNRRETFADGFSNALIVAAWSIAATLAVVAYLTKGGRYEGSQR